VESTRGDKRAKTERVTKFQQYTPSLYEVEAAIERDTAQSYVRQYSSHICQPQPLTYYSFIHSIRHTSYILYGNRSNEGWKSANPHQSHEPHQATWIHPVHECYACWGQFSWKDITVCETVCSIRNRACAPRIRFSSPVLRIHYLRGHTTVIAYMPVARSWNTSCSVCNQRQIGSFVTFPAKRFGKHRAVLT
jgi:hypothetical protein